MLPNDVTLNSNVYSLQTQRATSSVRGDGNRDLDKPVSLTIAHETTKGGRVSTVVVLSSDEIVTNTTGCNIVSVTDSVKVQFKIQYNPTIGRTNTATELARLQADMITFIQSAGFARVLNRES